MILNQKIIGNGQPNIFLLMGNIASGKSRAARRLKMQYGGIIANMDSLLESVEGNEFYDEEHKDIYQSAHFHLIEIALASGENVIIDRTNVDKKRREKYFEAAQLYHANVIGIIFPDSDIARRMKQSRCRTKEYWERVADKMRENWEEPTIEEGFSALYTMPEKFVFWAFDFDRTIASVDHDYQITGIQPHVYVDERKLAKEATLIPVMKRIWEDQKNIICIWSVRYGEKAYLMKEFLVTGRIPHDFLNENPMQWYGESWGKGNAIDQSRKIYADYYVDDKNISIFELLRNPAIIDEASGEHR